jgi:transposase
MEMLAMIRQAFGEESMSCTRVFEWHARFRASRTSIEDDQAKSRACSSFSLTSRGLFTKKSSWQAKQSILYATVTFYGDCENVRRLQPELWGQKNWLLHHNNAPSHTSFFTREFLTKNNMTLIPHPPYSPDLAPCDFSLFHHLKIKLKGRRFDTTKAMEAESQAVLNTLTEHDFHDAFKKWQKLWERCIHAEGDYFEGDGGQ